MTVSVFPQQSKRWPLEGGLKRRLPVRLYNRESAEALWGQHYSAPGPPFRDPSGCSGSPGWAVRGQCSPSWLSAQAAPDRPCTRSPWATRVLSVGPETRSRPDAESSEPHFLLAGRGVGGEHFLLCTDSRGDVIAVSSFGQPPRGQRSAVGRAGARSQERALRLPTQPCAPPGLQSRKRPLDQALPSTEAPSCRAHLPPGRRGLHLQRLKTHFPCPVLIAVCLPGIFHGIKSCLPSPILPSSPTF